MIEEAFIAVSKTRSLLVFAEMGLPMTFFCTDLTFSLLTASWSSASNLGK